MSMETLTIEEQEKLLKELYPDTGTVNQRNIQLRNYTMALLMLDAGLRVGELIQLQVSDLIFQGHAVVSLLVSKDIAKRHRERTVPLTTRTKEAITLMKLNIWDVATTIGVYYAFDKTKTHIPLSVRQVERIIKYSGWNCLGRMIHPHLLRHTFATRLMKVTNIRTVQQCLGHKYLSSTQVYTHPGIQDKIDAINAIENNS